MRVSALALAALILLPASRAAASTILLDDRAESHAVLPYVETLRDPTGSLDAREAAALPVSPGGSAAFVWLRFAVRIPEAGTRDPWALVVGHPRDRGTVFVEEPGGFRAVPIPLDPAGRSARVALPREPGTWRILVRVPGPLTRPSLFHVATPAGQEQLLQRLLAEQGIYLGVLVAMLLVNGLVGVLLRDKTQLWYVGFIATSVAAFSLLQGTASRFVFPTVSAHALYRPEIALLAAIALSGVQFGRLFLETRRTAPRWDRVMRAYVVLSAIVGVAAFVVPRGIALDAAALLGVLVPFVAIPAGVVAWRAGSRWARFYLAGWSVFAAGAFLFALPLGVPGIDGLGAFQACSAAEAAFFSVALVDRMRLLQRDRATAEQKVLRAEQLASLGQLVAGVAHEVQNPNNFLTFNLPIVQQYLDVLRPHAEEAARRDPALRLYGLTVDEFFADASKLVGNMRHGTERISAIVSQLRSFVRQNDDAHLEEADVNRVVESATTLVGTELTARVSRFSSRLGDGLPRVRMNPGRIEQVVINLLLNAAHAAGPTGRVEIRTAREDGHVTIAVEDDGPGVPADVGDRIFEPFFTTKSGEQGTGMGLAISRRIVDEHGGTLSLASEGGPGARFVVRLPIPVERT